MRNPIDIDGFKSIGLVKFYTDFEFDDIGWKDACFEIYLPKKLSNKRGETYCLRFIYLDDEYSFGSFLFETNDINVTNDGEWTCVGGIKVIMSDRQLEKVKELASREIPRVNDEIGE